VEKEEKNGAKIRKKRRQKEGQEKDEKEKEKGAVILQI
jgi:hypothetical protein